MKDQPNTNQAIKIKVDDMAFHYGRHLILNRVTARFRDRAITAVVGPSGTGKSTFLLTLNRLWETIPGARMTGRVEIRFNGRFMDIYNRRYPVTQLRRTVGMVFQAPNPLPMSIYKNVAFPLRLVGGNNRRLMEEKVETVLKRTYLWDETKDRLNQNAMVLSGGQQQRLCIARALILDPEVLLLDEPTSSLDGKAADKIESLLVELKAKCALIVVSHYMDQVKRIADEVMAPLC